MKPGYFWWKNLSILNWGNARPLSLSIFSRHKNFSFIMTCPAICLLATQGIHDMAFDEGWCTDIRQAWRAVVHAAPPSDSWKTIDYVRRVSSFSLLPWCVGFSFPSPTTPLLIIVFWLSIMGKPAYVSMKIKICLSLLFLSQIHTFLLCRCACVS